MRSDPNQLPEWITWTRLISGMFIFCTTIFGCIWYILDLQYSSRYQGKIDILEKENNGFREIARINLPAMLENVSTISQQLDKNVKEIMISKEVMNNFEKIKGQNTELQTRITELQEENLKSKQLIGKLTPKKESFTLIEGSSGYITGTGMYLGINSVNCIDGYVKITFDNKSYTLKVGEYVDCSIGKSPCKLFLTIIDDYECCFTLLCEGKNF